jgi:branched-chain amino acid transport system permease protein
MRFTRFQKIVLLCALFLFLILVPVFIQNWYHLGVITTILRAILLVTSFWIISSTGQVSMGHAAFAAIGAYISAALVASYGFNSWMSLPIAIITAGAVAAIIGFISLRITGIYFIITTVAFVSVVQIVFGMWEHPFGGLSGITQLPPPDPIAIPGLPSIDFGSKPSLYYLTLVFVVVCVVLLYGLNRSTIGRIFRGISSSDKLAEHVGINIMAYKVLAFVIGSMCAGLVGVLYTYSAFNIQTTTFTMTQSMYCIVYSAVGGLTTFVGPIIGAVVLNIISEVLRPINDYEMIIYALLLIVTILVFKSGLYGLFQKLGENIVRHFNKTNKVSVKSEAK